MHDHVSHPTPDGARTTPIKAFISVATESVLGITDLEDALPDEAEKPNPPTTAYTATWPSAAIPVIVPQLLLALRVGQQRIYG